MSISSIFFIKILQLVGIKKDFQKENFDYKNLRKNDVKNIPWLFKRKLTITKFYKGETVITNLLPKNQHKGNNFQILYIPGGAFVSGPTLFQWSFLKNISLKTGLETSMIDYPKAPEHNITSITNIIDTIYNDFIAQYPEKKLILIGDSVGANLILSLCQRLIALNKKLPMLNVLITPVFDASLSNPEIEKIDAYDPMLSKNGALAAKKLCATGLDLKDELISPLYGSFNKLPETILLLGGKDIMYPDGKIAETKFIKNGVKLHLIEDKEMIHIWPLLPIMQESKTAKNKIIDHIKQIIFKKN